MQTKAANILQINDIGRFFFYFFIRVWNYFYILFSITRPATSILYDNIGIEF